MASSLFGQSQANPNPQNNPTNLIEQINKLKQDFAGQDPQTIVQNLLKSGRMTQQQFEQFSQMAKQFEQLMR